MMSGEKGDKEIITYKRRKPPLFRAYKRRKLSPGDDSDQKNESPGTLTTSEQKETSTHGNESECPKKDFEHAPEEKGLAIKQQDDLISAEKAKNELQEAISIQGSSSSIIDSHSASDEKSTVACSIPLPTCCSSSGDIHNLSLKTSDTNERKPNRLSMNAATGSKFSSPVITFSRRFKRKKDLDGLQMQHKIDLNCDGSKESANVSAQEGSQSHKGSEHALIASGNVESSCAGARSSPESGSFKQADLNMGSTLIEGTSTVKVHPQITEVNDGPSDKNVGLDLQGPSGNSSNDSTVEPVLEPGLFNHHSSTGEESQILSDSGLNAERGTHEIRCERGSTEPMALSVPRSGQCGIASVHDEMPLGTSRYAPFGSHITQSNDESVGIKGLKLLHKNVGETHSSHQLEVLKIGCRPEETVCSHHNGLTNSSPVVTLRESCLQLFPEKSMDNMSHSTKMNQKDSTGSKERALDPSASSSHDRTAEAKSSLFLGLVLPMELLNHGRSSASSQWPICVPSREFLPDAVPKGFPGQPLTSRRHKAMLDSIVNRARTPKRTRNSCLNVYGFPTMWSQEELDSLWVGVRRYGRGNWDSMIRDPRFNFSPWRTPWDLAQKWEEEQSKLLNTLPVFQGRHFRQPSASQVSMDGFCLPKIGKQEPAEDVQLSLGDVYSKSKDSVCKRAHIVNIQNNAPRQHQQAVTTIRTVYSDHGSHRRSVFLDATRDVGSSCANNSTEMAMGRSCPHWLQGLVAIPHMPHQAALPSDTSASTSTSAVGPVDMHQPRDAEPWNKMSNKNVIPGVGKLQIGVAAQAVITPPTKGHGQTKLEQHPAKDQQVIEIESDASSEGTISDDRSSAKVKIQP